MDPGMKGMRGVLTFTRVSATRLIHLPFNRAIILKCKNEGPAFQWAEVRGLELGATGTIHDESEVLELHPHFPSRVLMFQRLLLFTLSASGDQDSPHWSPTEVPESHLHFSYAFGGLCFST